MQNAKTATAIALLYLLRIIFRHNTHRIMKNSRWCLGQTMENALGSQRVEKKHLSTCAGKPLRQIVTFMLGLNRQNVRVPLLTLSKLRGLAFLAFRASLKSDVSEFVVERLKDPAGKVERDLLNSPPLRSRNGRTSKSCGIPAISVCCFSLSS